MFSLIIPIYNSNNIEKQLLSIEKNYKSKYEVIFVDDGSDNNYKLYYNKLFSKHKNLKIIYYYLADKKGKNRVTKARNIGVELSNYDNLVFIDQDTLLHKNYFNLLYKNMRGDILLGQSLGYNNKKKIINNENISFFIENGYINKTCFNDFRLDFYKEKTKRNRLWEFFAASNLYIKKDIFLKENGFNKNITAWGDEDVEFGYRLYKKGYKLKFCKDLKVLNLSKKLYIYPFRILNSSNITSLTKNFLFNYKNNNKTIDYKRYILDRFLHFDYNQKILSDKNFNKEILHHNFYKNKGKKFVFFRIDDVKEYSLNLVKLLKIFIKFNIPLVLAIEPGNIDNNIVKYIKYIKQKKPKLIDIVQHGYKHLNYSIGKYKYEFGNEKSYSNQLFAIKHGYSIMQNYFGKNFFKAFIPPYNNMNNNTEIVINKLGYKIISSGYPYQHYLGREKIISIPAYIDIIKNYDNIEYKGENSLYNDINYYIYRDGFVGILLHPQFFNDKAYTLVIKLFKYLKGMKLDFINLSDFYKLYNTNEKKYINSFN